MKRAVVAHQKSADVAREVGDEDGVLLPLAGLANTHTALGDYDAARRYNEAALALAERHGDVHSQAQVREALGLVALEQGDTRRAAAQFRASARLCLEVGSLELLCYCLVGLAGVALADGAFERAVQLLGAAEGLRERADLGVWPVREVLQRRLVDLIRSRLVGSTAVLAQSWVSGRALSMLVAAELALSDSAPARVEVASLSSAGPLTPRELEVAKLIAQGKTSKEIADVLVITERTADTHAGHIRDKLGLRSRAEIAAWVVREGLQAAPD
ncbi:MAG TPA: LuxR C-terminal-related transcriptional regulator [Chloroflexota bacterium]|nr:LuxR C-terminal-related transcriptional regulator [Chloroflexota bacterium]